MKTKIKLKRLRIFIQADVLKSFDNGIEILYYSIC